MTKAIQSGSVSKFGKDHQFCYLNFRPIDLPRKLRSLVQDLYQQYNPNSLIWVFMNILAKDGSYDINVAPDKREVFLQDEAKVVQEFKSYLVGWFEQMQVQMVADK
jgi:DNA mismatch repair protein PMS2